MENKALFKDLDAHLTTMTKDWIPLYKGGGLDGCEYATHRYILTWFIKKGIDVEDAYELADKFQDESGWDWGVS